MSAKTRSRRRAFCRTKCCSTLKCNNTKTPEGALHRQMGHPHDSQQQRWFPLQIMKMVQPQEANVCCQDHAEQKLAGLHGPWHPLQLPIDGLANQFAELQPLKHRRHRQQSSVGGQIPARKTILCRGTDFVGPSRLFPAIPFCAVRAGWLLLRINPMGAFLAQSGGDRNWHPSQAMPRQTEDPDIKTSANKLRPGAAE